MILMVKSSPAGGPWARHSRSVSVDGRITKEIETAAGANRLPASTIPVNIEMMVLLAADSFTQRS